jgi:hypothetical protein
MKRFFRDRVRGAVMRWVAATVVGSVMTVSWWAGWAQTIPEQGTQGGTYTLHVYTDLLQVPTIVLTPLHSNYRALTKESFTLSLDGGPKFHPTNVRLEGDDPITIAVLLDLTTDDNSMFASFASAMSTLPAGVFSARDYISVYAYDCKLMRTTDDKPATPEQLQASMVQAMTEGRGSARNGAKQSCWRNKRLYDAVARVSQDMGDLPGRRVVLVISDGEDRHSTNDWLTVARFAGNKSVAIFGIRPVRTPTGTTKGYSGSDFNDGWLTVEESDSFGRLCGTSGGSVLDGDRSKRLMSGQIQRLMTMLRNRYIIEFPRPANGSAGFFAFEVQAKDPTAIIRAAGIAFPPREGDPKQPDGTVPQDPSQMPLVGSKHEQNQPK